MTKEVSKRNHFLSAIIKNLNWKILTRIQLLLKDGMGVKMENFDIMWVHWKNHFLGERWCDKNPIYIEELPKSGGLDSLQI